MLSVMAAVSLLYGCGKEISDNVQQTEKKDDKIVTMMAWYTYKEMQKPIDEINRQLKGEYKVEYRYISLEDYNNVLSTQLSAGEGPDIIIDGSNFPARIKAGNLEDISDRGYTDEFQDVGMTLCKQDGKIYGIPSYGWFSGIFYNKDIFAANGITKFPETFEELCAICEKLQNNNVRPFSIGLAGGDMALHFLCGYLENTFYREEKDPGSFDYEFAYGRQKMNGTMNSYIDKWEEVVDRGILSPEMVGMSSDQALKDFCEGKAAMTISGPWTYDDYKKAGLNFGMMPYVGNNADEHYILGGPAASYGLNVNAKNKKGAEKVLKVLAGVDVQQAFLESHIGSFSFRAGVEERLPEEYDGVRDCLKAGRYACCWERWGKNMPSQAMVDEAIEQLQEVIVGTKSTEDFLKAMDSKADSIRYIR